MKKITSSRLNNLWSKAVKAKYRRCPFTGSTEDLQAHHIIPKGRQNRFALRWDIRNGVPLSAQAHRSIHDGDMDAQKKLIAYVEERGDKDYLMSLKHKLKYDFLKDLGLTEEEYKLMVKEQLETILED